MEHIDIINYNRLSTISRKSILEPIAESLNIDFKNFRNKTLLLNEIRTKYPANKQCVNECDFITLCPLNDIPCERLFIWRQFNHTFGADIISLHSYIESNNTINPWAIDYATGYSISHDEKLYLDTFDMSRQKFLLTRMRQYYKEFITLNTEIEDFQIDDNPTNNLRFKIEDISEICGQYITPVLTYLENASSISAMRFLFECLNITNDYFVQMRNSDCINVIRNVYLFVIPTFIHELSTLKE